MDGFSSNYICMKTLLVVSFQGEVIRSSCLKLQLVSFSEATDVVIVAVASESLINTKYIQYLYFYNIVWI